MDQWLPGQGGVVGRGSCHDGTVWYSDCNSVNILAMILCNNCLRGYHWEKLGKVYRGINLHFFLSYM